MEKVQTSPRLIGENIGFEMGARFVKNYYDNTGTLLGHVFGAKILQDIFSQSNVEGIRFYQAINEYGENTLVAVGVDEQGSDVTHISKIGLNGITYTPAIVADRAITCPPYCSPEDLPENPLGW